MSEKFESSIERRNKRVTFEMGRAALLFDYTNTILYEHPEPYRNFDNVTLSREDGERHTLTAYFREDNPELYETLQKENFPRMFVPYPAEMDEECWVNNQDALLAQDIERFEERGELY